MHGQCRAHGLSFTNRCIKQFVGKSGRTEAGSASTSRCKFRSRTRASGDSRFSDRSYVVFDTARRCAARLTVYVRHRRFKSIRFIHLTLHLGKTFIMGADGPCTKARP